MEIKNSTRQLITEVAEAALAYQSLSDLGKEIYKQGLEDFVDIAAGINDVIAHNQIISPGIVWEALNGNWQDEVGLENFSVYEIRSRTRIGRVANLRKSILAKDQVNPASLILSMRYCFIKVLEAQTLNCSSIQDLARARAHLRKPPIAYIGIPRTAKRGVL